MGGGTSSPIVEEEGGGGGGGGDRGWVVEVLLGKGQGMWSSLVFEEIAWFQGEARRLYGGGVRYGDPVIEVGKWVVGLCIHC